MDPGRMVPLTTVPDVFTARVIAARLGSEGILTEVKGGDGPYPIGEVTVYVEPLQMEAAREILVVEEAEAAVTGPDASRTPASLWLVLAALAMLVIFSYVRMFV